jgi:hypothetical protein
MAGPPAGNTAASEAAAGVRHGETVEVRGPADSIAFRAADADNSPMPLSVGPLPNRLRFRELAVLVATVVAVALIGAPALSPSGLLYTPLTQNNLPAPPGEDSEDDVPDDVHCSRPTVVSHDTGPRYERRGEHPAAFPQSSRSHPAAVTRSAPPAPPGTGAGVRLRC